MHSLTVTEEKKKGNKKKKQDQCFFISRKLAVKREYKMTECASRYLTSDTKVFSKDG